MEKSYSNARKSVHANLDATTFRYRSMKTHLHLIQVDVDQFFTISANFRNLAIKIDGVPAAWAIRNHDPNDFCTLFHC